jgi:hypothetical protein
VNSPPEWLSAFPIRPATEAVEALVEGWRDLAARPIASFNPKTHEAALTKTLKVYVENVIAPQRGLLGMWAAEDIIGDVDPATGGLIEERRTDVVYGWNDAIRDMRLVFEFKRLAKGKRHRSHYLESEGLGRFVTGIYSRKQAVAAMVGVLLDPAPEIVPAIVKALEDAALGKRLRLRPAASGMPITEPSALFAMAAFDTEHERDAALAPMHGSIRVSHFFLAFGYPSTTTRSKAA